MKYSIYILQVDHNFKLGINPTSLTCPFSNDKNKKIIYI